MDGWREGRREGGDGEKEGGRAGIIWHGVGA